MKESGVVESAAVSGTADTYTNGPVLGKKLPGKSISAAKGMSLDVLMTKKFKSLCFSVHGMIAEGVSILGGKPKTGKSWLAQHIALEVARGGKVMGEFSVEQGGVLYLALEDHEERLQSRYSKSLQGDAPPANLHLYTKWPRLKEGGEVALKKWLMEHHGTQLIVIDTLERIRPLGRQGGSQYGHDYAVGAILSEIATKYHVSILLVHHLRKTSARDPIDLLSGTMGLSGGVDNVLILQRNRADDNMTLFVTGRDIENELNLAISHDTATGAWSVLGDAMAVCHGEERQEVIGFLQEAAGARTAREIATGLGRTLEATRKLVRRMVQDGLLTSQAGFRYGLPVQNDGVGE
ncbi:MAG: AAA family ATPase [Magnetococcus sp. XQGC-1]